MDFTQFASVGPDAAEKLYKDLPEDQAAQAYEVLKARSDAEEVKNFKKILRIQSKEYPLLGLYFIHPEQQGNFFPGYHATNYCLGLRILNEGFKDGSYFGYGSGTTYLRKEIYARNPLGRMLTNVIGALLKHSERKKLAENPEECYTLFREMMKSPMQLGMDLVGDRVPKDLVNFEECQGCFIEVLVPKECVKPHRNGKVEGKKFVGYEIQTTGLPKECVVSMIKLDGIITENYTIDVTLPEFLASDHDRVGALVTDYRRLTDP